MATFKFFKIYKILFYEHFLEKFYKILNFLKFIKKFWCPTLFDRYIF